MIESAKVGLDLIAFSAFALVPAAYSGEIPSNWPFRPLTRAKRPISYRLTVIVCTIQGLIGLMLVAANLLAA